MRNLKRTAILLLASGFSFVAANAQMPRFEYHKIAEIGKQMGQTSLADVDKDGDLDWVTGERTRSWWFEYQAPDTWVRHDIGAGASTDVGGTMFDVDSDGWLDQATGDSWYRNTGKPREEAFVRHPNGALSCHDDVAADIDGDGKLDLVALSDKADQINWYKIPDDPTQPWIETRIGTGIHAGVDPHGVGDLDGDGDADVVRGNVWYENLDGKGKDWEERAEFTPAGGNRPDRYGLALKSWVCDLDEDGDLDLVQAEADTVNARVYWFENSGGAKGWTFHLVSPDTTKQDFHSLAVADFDNDGDLDAFSGGGPLSESEFTCFIWENAGNAKSWKQHVLLTGKRCHEAKAADVDGDGDIDICTKAWSGDLHFYLRNMLIEDGK